MVVNLIKPFHCVKTQRHKEPEPVLSTQKNSLFTLLVTFATEKAPQRCGE